MNFFSKLWETTGISGASSGSPLSNYTMGDPIATYDPGHRGIWTMKTGQPKKGAATTGPNGVSGPITIFEYDPRRVPNGREPFAKNSLRRTKTLRHPSILSYVDSAEPTAGGVSSVVIATEYGTPLEDSLEALRRFPNAVSWGILQIARAVSFLNECQVIHGNISTSTVFVTRSGDWKLWGLEMATEVATLGSSSLVSISGDFSTGERPPECAGYGWGDKIDKSCATAIDAFMFGRFIEDVFSKVGIRMPQELAVYVSKLTAMNPRSRMSVKELLEIGYFANPYVDALTFLDNITLKENAEKDAFFSNVLAPLVDQIPANVALYKVLPHLISTIEFGYSQPSVKKIMPVLLKLVKDLPENDFATIVTPHIVKWFAASDRIMRACLLESISCYVEKLPKSAATGFVDASPVIRDLTVRSMIYFVPMIDQEASIRTNTTICLGKIAKYINDSTKGKVLIPAFTRALKDSFAPARVAGVVALYLTRDYYTPLECACSIIPAIAPHLLDPDKNVRDESKRLLTAALEKVNEKADEMTIADENKAAAAAAAAAAGPKDNGAPQGEQGWSLIQSISKKITSSSTPNDVKPAPATTTPAAATSTSAKSMIGMNTLSSGSNSSNYSGGGMKLGMSTTPPPASTSPKTTTTSTFTSSVTPSKPSASVTSATSSFSSTSSSFTSSFPSNPVKETTNSGWDIDDDEDGFDDDNWGDSDNLIFNSADTQKQQQPKVTPTPAATTATTRTTTMTSVSMTPKVSTATATTTTTSTTTQKSSTPSKGMTLGTQRHTATATAPKKEEKKPTVTKLSGAWDWDDGGDDGW